MKNIKRGMEYLFLFLSVFLMSSCTYYQQYQAHMAHKKSCYSDCGARFRYCSTVCDQNAKYCNEKADALAAVHFNQYRRQQAVIGALATLEMNSFRDPLACLRSTCECTKDYEVCRASCRGHIYKRLQKVAPGELVA